MEKMENMKMEVHIFRSNQRGKCFSSFSDQGNSGKNSLFLLKNYVL